MTAALHADTSRVGASFISKRAVINPREIIVRLVEQNPASSKDDLFRMFREEIDLDGDVRRAVEWYFFVNMYEYLVTSRNRKPSVQRRAQSDPKTVEKIKRQIVEIVLLDLMLPSGKLLRDATFSDCAKAGGFFAKIAKKGKPNQVVGKVLTEDQLRALR